jgi:hypothetical protein
MLILIEIQQYCIRNNPEADQTAIELLMTIPFQFVTNIILFHICIQKLENHLIMLGCFMKFTWEDPYSVSEIALHLLGFFDAAPGKSSSSSLMERLT